MGMVKRRGPEDWQEPLMQGGVWGVFGSSAFRSRGSGLGLNSLEDREGLVGQSCSFLFWKFFSSAFLFCCFSYLPLYVSFSLPIRTVDIEREKG